MIGGMPSDVIKVWALACVASSTLGWAQPVAPTPGAGGGSQLPLPPQVQTMNGVLAPVPGEIFRTLDTFRDANWRGVLQPDLTELRVVGGPPRIALSLGLVIGEGFIAIAADEPDEVQDLGKTALKLARALGVEASVLRRGKSVVDYAEKGDMDAVREEWSGVSTDLKEAMRQIRSASLPQLVTLGGWLRGLEALTVLIGQRYTPESAQLLYQPALLDAFEQRIAEMPAKVRLSPAVKEMSRGIVTLRPLIGRDPKSTPLTAGEVKKVRKIAGDLVKGIYEE